MGVVRSLFLRMNKAKLKLQLQQQLKGVSDSELFTIIEVLKEIAKERKSV